MFLLRDVQKSDLRDLSRLAEVLNTVNLPSDEGLLEELIDRSVRSFSGRIKNPLEREYLFVLEDPRRELLVGTSMIIAQHGTREAPHVYYDVGEREHYSASIDKHVRHKILSIGYNYEGPTEIGGLVVEPSQRAGEEKPGKQLSFARFLFIGMNRALFRQTILAELLPPLLPDARSLLWEACGEKFTGLTYQEADRLSRQNKEFIKELFPQSDIYATLFDERTQKVLGEVGPQTVGVQRMLERIGFRYVERIDPFDGGPHFEAKVSDITLIQKFLQLKVAKEELDPKDASAEEMIVGMARDSGRNRFRAVRCRVLVRGNTLMLPAKARDLLDVSPGSKVSAVPFS
jgi:arginine N-succinyltransferase